MELANLFSSIERTLLSRFNESGFISHSGDKGENREEILIEFLKNHLPSKYGITKGEVINSRGKRSHAIDIIIYDAINCPVLYVGKTSILPIEGVYGIIEVKSTLSKTEFIDAANKIESFKRMATGELGLEVSKNVITPFYPSRPFGIIFGYKLSNNSLDSLQDNWIKQSKKVHDVNYFVNLTCVLNEGLLCYEKVNFSLGTKEHLLDTDDYVDLIALLHKRIANNEETDEIILRIISEKVNDNTFGRFITYLLIMVTKLKLKVPDLTRYIDPDLPIAIIKQ